MSDYTLSVNIEADAKKFDSAMKSVRQGLRGAGDLSDESGGKISMFGDVLKANLISGAVMKGLGLLTSGLETIGGALIDVGKSAVSAFADYEQLSGGIETLFGAGGRSIEEYAAAQGAAVDDIRGEYENLIQAQDDVMNNAREAYRTAGISANDYMEAVTGIAAALKASTDDNREAAAVADMAMKDMADNANKMGTEMDSIQAAYQGFAKGQYQLLDNLKLGFGGSRSEMERLLATAEELTGVHYDINNLSDVYNAIHVIQENLGITGTTAKEAMDTLSGSANMTKAAWENVLTAIGTGEGLDTALNDLMLALFGDEEGGGFLNNLIPVIERVIDGVGVFISQAAPLLEPHILPLLQGAAEFISQELPKLAEYLSPIKDVLAEMAPEILKLVGDLMLQNLKAIGELMLENISGILGDISECFWDWVTGAASDLFDAAVGLIGDFIEGLLSMFDDIGGSARDLAQKIIDTIKETDWLGLGSEIFENFKSGISQKIEDVRSAAGDIVDAVQDKVMGIADSAWNWGRDIISGLADGIWDALSNNWLTSAVSSAADTIRSYLHFTEPDVGPLSDFHTYAPDMIDMLISGMKAGEGRIAEAAGSLAGVIGGGLSVEGMTAATAGGYTSGPAYNTNNNNISVTVNGAPGQDVNELATAVGDEIMRRMRRA